MAGSRSPWRALRPVFLAGAATLTWLTFSASAASADTLQDATSLLGGVTGSVSSVAEELPLSVASLADAAPAASEPAPDTSPGLLQPVAGEVSGLADQVISAVPVVGDVIPSGTVSVIALPVAESVDAATAVAVEAVVPSVTEALPALEPVLQPVADLAADTSVLPLPEISLAVPVNEVPAGAASDAVAVPATLDGPATPTESALSGAARSGTPEVAESHAAPAGQVLVTTAYMPLQTAVVQPDSAEKQPGTADPSPAPSQAPPPPGSGTGSSVTSAAGSGTAAWLSTFNLTLPPNGIVLAGEFSEHTPAPVSFDPGSSPD
jgi:hypothetical protein